MSLRRRGGRRRGGHLETDSELLLAAMVDMMVNVLLFLLTLYGAAPGSDVGEIELPGAHAQEPIAAQVHLTITPLVVAVNGNTALRLNNSPEGPKLPEGRAGLEALQAKLLTRLGGGDEVPPLAVEIDRRVPWSVVRPLLDVAGQAGFTDLRFVVTSVRTSESGGP